MILNKKRTFPCRIVLENITHRRLIGIVKKVVKEKWEFVAINSPPNKRGKWFNVVASKKMWDKEDENLYRRISREQKKEERLRAAGKMKPCV